MVGAVFLVLATEDGIQNQVIKQRRVGSAKDPHAHHLTGSRHAPISQTPNKKNSNAYGIFLPATINNTQPLTIGSGIIFQSTVP